MSVSPHKSYRRHEGDFNTNSCRTFHVPVIERIKYRPLAPNITGWGSSLSNLPQSYSTDTPQVGYAPYRHFSSNTLHPPEQTEGSTKMCYVPKSQNTKPSNDVMGLELIQYKDISFDKYPLNNSSNEITKSNIPLLYKNDPEFQYSSKPVLHPITNSLDTLPQQMSKAPIESGHYANTESMLSKHKHEKVQFPGAQDVPQLPLYAIQFQELFRTKSPCFEQYNPTRIKNELNLPQDVQDSFAKFRPLLKTINSRNHSAILVEIFRNFNGEISLDELFNLLYCGKSTFETTELNPKFSHKDILNPTYLKLKALKIFGLILMTFQYPKITIGYFPGVSVQTLRVSPATYHKILRNFLAIKIIFDSVKKSDYPSRDGLSTSRLSIYKVYYIICQKLLQKYSTISPYPGFEKTLILSQPKISKITNLIYPNIITKRLGKRGESKAHYIGLILNNITVDQEISRLLELDIPQLRTYFRSKSAVNAEAVEQNAIERNKLSSAADPYSTDPVPGFQNKLDTHVQSRYNNRDLKTSDHHCAQIPHKVREQSMGPTLIWKDIWRP
ncbi:hypothetical protein JCM33374_g5245 [Metschnikowia sp. JCM 33374]|nr:hypothetical protein JCM33374_g5245 [Metschnikowia sp. JCM 33374]